MNIGLIYFSATNNTETIGKIIKHEIEAIESSVKVFLINITPYSTRNNHLNLAKCEKFIFGFPVYGWRVPNVVREWLKTLEGKGRECAMFFTYGGINSGVVHYDTYKILNENDFKVLSSAEFIASHTYNLGGWNILENRPNEEDFEIARQYSRSILKQFQESNPILFQIKPHEYSDKTLERIENNPKRMVKIPRWTAECDVCGVCNNLCPTNAIDAENQIIKDEKCIRCLSCVFNCPESVLKVDDLTRLYKMALKVEHLTEKEINNRKSKIF
ncbi:MAG: 4Fe-4S ferredoxin [Candidatus Lokiarchaeota archaeon]|nr:4Fe-4S ferredoxin [Candidatus Lokiarchaeota archaeon]